MDLIVLFLSAVLFVALSNFLGDERFLLFNTIRKLRRKNNEQNYKKTIKSEKTNSASM